MAPLQSHAHKDEGFALDWSRAAEGRLAAGDNKRAIHVWEPLEGAPRKPPGACSNAEVGAVAAGGQAIGPYSVAGHISKP